MMPGTATAGLKSSSILTRLLQSVCIGLVKIPLIVLAMIKATPLLVSQHHLKLHGAGASAVLANCTNVNALSLDRPGPTAARPLKAALLRARECADALS